MKKNFILLFAVVIFLGAANVVLAQATQPSGFGVTLVNPLCLAGDKCTTPVPQCDNGKWQTDTTGYLAVLPPPQPSLTACCSFYGAVAPTSPCVNSFPQFIKQISGYIVGLISSLVVIMIVWAGFLFVTSGGNPGKIQTAKQVLIWAIVGAGIALASAGLIAVITAVIGPPPV